MSSQVNKLRGFYEDLIEAIKTEEKGIYWDILKYAPSFFKLLCDILDDERADWYTRLIIDAALAYFVMPNDIISENEHGATGFIDDVFLCAYVLNEIKNKSDEKLLVDNWSEKSDILLIVDSVLSNSKKIIINNYSAILKFVGLRKESNLPTLIDKDNIRYEKLLLEKRELLGLLSFVTRIIYNSPPHLRKIDQLKKYLESQDSYETINKISVTLDYLTKRGVFDESK